MPCFRGKILKAGLLGRVRLNTRGDTGAYVLAQNVQNQAQWPMTPLYQARGRLGAPLGVARHETHWDFRVWGFMEKRQAQSGRGTEWSSATKRLVGFTSWL